MTQLLPLNAIENPPSFRNAVINGDCLVAQRGNVAVSNNATTYGGADRIYFFSSGFTTISGTISRINGSATSNGYAQSIALTTTGTGQVQFGTRLESKDTARFNSKTVTVSMKVYQDTGSAQTLTLGVNKATATDNFASTSVVGTSSGISIPSATWTPVSATFTLGATDGVYGLQIMAYFASIGALTGKTFAIGDLQFEQGSVASVIENPPYAESLYRCYRYYEAYTYSVTTYNGGASSGIQAGGIAFRAPKVNVPTVTFGSLTYANASALVTRGTITTTGCPLSLTVTAAGPATVDFAYVANAEL